MSLEAMSEKRPQYFWPKALRIISAGLVAGGIRTETFRAFTEEEYKKIIAALP
jgi:uncharacterized protein with GYD domain